MESVLYALADYLLRQSVQVSVVFGLVLPGIWLLRNASAHWLFFFHPLIWWTNRGIRKEREKCCDEMALSGTGTQPQLYCEAIVEMLAGELEASCSAPALAVAGSTRTIEERMRTMLTPHRKFRRRPSRITVAVLLFAAACALPSALVLTTRADTGDETGATQAEGANEWQTGQVMNIRVVDAQTQEPLPGVNLELQNMGPGIDFQDIKVQTTDADGRSLIRLPDLPPIAVRVYPSKAGFVPLRVYWEGEPWPAMPRAITIPMPRGRAIGGTIQNDSGQPIPGVAVSVHYWGTGSGNNPHVRANIDAKTTSDEDGRWQVDVMPAKMDESKLLIYVSHPDYVSDHLKRAIFHTPVTERPPISELFQQTAVMTMRQGDTISGHVVDDTGRPIPNAAIHDSEYYWFRPGTPRASTNSSGEFRLTGIQSDTADRLWARTDNVLRLTVQATGFAPEFVDVQRFDAPLKIRLGPGHTVRGKIVDVDGQPVAGVSINAIRWREQSDRLHLEAKSATDGSFQISDVPTDEVDYDFSKEGYMMLEGFPMSPSTDDYLVTLKAPLRITGSVVDAETGQPLNRFKLIQGIDHGDGRAPDWLRYNTRVINNGNYETTFVQEEFLWRVRVEAEGYTPGESKVFRPYNPDQGEVKCDFKLTKAAPLTGTVLGLNGEPLVGANVYVATERLNVTNRNQVYHGNNRTTKTDGAGRFTFSAEVEPFCLVVVHEQGVAMMTEQEFENSTQISIQPWTAENQNLQIIRRPAPRQHVDFPPRDG